jgi:hypothetical protein
MKHRFLAALGCLVLVGVAAALLLGSLPLHTGQVQFASVPDSQQFQPPFDSPDTPPVKRSCAVTQAPSHSYTFDPGKESKYAYGPPVRLLASLPQAQSLRGARQELRDRLCGYAVGTLRGTRWVGGDWSLLASLKSEGDGGDPNRRFATAQEWATALDGFLDEMVWNKAILYNDPTSREVNTFYSVRGPDGVPVVRSTMKWEPPSTYLFLPVRRHDGTTKWLMLRLECGFQPVHPVKPLVVPGLPSL